MHRAGKTNINADLISRATQMDAPPPSNKDSITDRQKQIEVSAKLRKELIQFQVKNLVLQK